jgi:hypothetical protein
VRLKADFPHPIVFPIPRRQLGMWHQPLRIDPGQTRGRSEPRARAVVLLDVVGGEPGSIATSLHRMACSTAPGRGEVVDVGGRRRLCYIGVRRLVGAFRMGRRGRRREEEGIHVIVER